MTPGPDCTLAELLDWAGEEQLNARSAREVTRKLRAQALRTDRPLQEILADGGEERWSEQWDSPGRVIEGERLRDIATRVVPTRAPLVFGAVAVTLLAASVGWYRWLPYGIVILATGGVASFVGWRWFDALDRRLPDGVSRGAILGACIVLVPVIVALAILVAGRQVAGAAT